MLASVPLAQYGPGALEASLRNLEWVSEVALAHEAVVEHFVQLRGVLVVPMKLFTMFSTVERARAGLSPEETEAVGLALMRLEETVREIDADFGLAPEDLNLDLGPAGSLM